VTDLSGVNVVTPGYIVVGGGGNGAVIDDSGPITAGVTNSVSFPPPLIKKEVPSADRQITLQFTTTEGEGGFDWGINDTYAVLPSVPLYLSGGNFGMEDPDQIHVENVKVDEVVDILILGAMMTHPFHLHGHEFHVLGSAQQGEELVIDETNPVLRDTVIVPAMGQTMIRVKFNNPGPWVAHCHIDLHLVAGMALVFNVGEPSEWPAPNAEFPPALCGGTEDFIAMKNDAYGQQFVTAGANGNAPPVAFSRSGEVNSSAAGGRITDLGAITALSAAALFLASLAL